jgi:hypothetical protein
MGADKGPFSTLNQYRMVRHRAQSASPNGIPTVLAGYIDQQATDDNDARIKMDMEMRQAGQMDAPCEHSTAGR